MAANIGVLAMPKYPLYDYLFKCMKYNGLTISRYWVTATCVYWRSWTLRISFSRYTWKPTHRTTSFPYCLQL